jgi:hypothetical protein
MIFNTFVISADLLQHQFPSCQRQAARYSSAPEVDIGNGRFRHRLTI